jgi:hypothetical protein
MPVPTATSQTANPARRPIRPDKLGKDLDDDRITAATPPHHGSILSGL